VRPHVLKNGISKHTHAKPSISRGIMVSTVPGYY